MAVEIPVVIDIEQAFQDAANRVSSAIKPLENKLDAYTSKMQLKVGIDENGKEKLKSVNELLNVIEKKQGAVTRKSISSLAELSTALSDAENKLMRLYAIEDAGYSLSKKQKKDKEALEKTIVATRAVIEQRQHGIRLLQEETDAQIRAKRAEEERLSIMSKVTTTMNDLSAKMGAVQGQLNSTKMFSPEWYNLLPTLGQLRNEIQSVQNQMQQFSSSVGSLDRYNAKLQEIVQSFNAMSSVARGGNQPSTRLRQLQTEYADVKQAIDQVSRSLSAEYEARKKSAEQQERINRRLKESIQQRRYEESVLKMSGNSIRVLNEQQRILTERLSKVKIGSDEFKNLQKRLSEVNAELRKATGGVNTMTTAMKKQSVVLSNLTSIASMYLSVFGALRLVKQIRDVTGELEFQRISLGRLIQDVERGNYLFERIKEQAIESPFRIKDLVTYTKQLAAYRVEQEELFHTTKRLADISAGLGVDMNRLILAYGQVRAASVLRGQELRQFTEAGIPLVQLLAEKFTDLNGEMMTTGEVFKKISDRAVPFSMISDIFEDLTEKGGMFYQMQEEQAKTLKGRWEKLKDAYDVALQSIGDTETFQRQNDIVIGSLRFIADNLRVMTKLVDAAILSWASYNAVLWISGVRTKAVATAEQEALIAESLRTKKVSGLFAKIKAQAWAEAELASATRTATIGTNALSRALAKLKIALLTNPYAFAAAAIIGIVLALTRYKKAVDDSAEATHTLNRAVDDMRAFNKRHDRVQKLIDQYEKLTTLEERNAAQNETLARTTKKLAAEFPQLSESLNNNNLSLQERLDIVKELNKEEAKRIEDEITDKTRTLEANRTKLTYAKEDQVTAENAKKEAEAYYLALKKELDNLGEKEGRGAFMKFMFGGNEYDEIYRQLAMQRKVLDEAEEKANKAGDSVRSLEDAIDSLEQEIGNSNKTTQEADETWEEWKKQIHELQKGMLKLGDSPLFGKDDISGFESVYDLSKKLKKEMDDLTVSIAAMKTMFASMEEGDAKDSMGKDIKKLETKLEVAKAIKEALNLTWKSSGSGRDSRLSDLKKDISEITNAYKKFAELRKYMSEGKAISEIGTLFPQLAGWEPTYANTIQRLEKMRADVAKKLAASPKDKTLLEMQRAIDTEISNLKFDNLKKKTEDELKRVSRELKRSEAARDFYNNILGITGDEELSASLAMSVYGGVGEDFKDRLQKEMFMALKGAPIGEEFTKELRSEFAGAIATLDLDFFRKNLYKLPDSVRETFSKALDEAEKYDAKWIEEIYKTYEKTKTFEERITDIRRREADQRKRISERTDLSESQKESLRAASRNKEERDVVEVQVEALKETEEWITAFEDLDKVGTGTLESLISMLEEFIEKAGSSMNAGTLRSLTKSLEQAREQIYKRNPLGAFKEGLVSYVQELSAAVRARKALAEGDEEARGALDFSKNNRIKSIEKMKSAVDGLSDVFSTLNSVVSAVSELLDFDELSDGKAVLDGIAKGIGTVAVALGLVNTLLTIMEMNPIVLAISAAVAAAAALANVISNIKVNRANKEIEKQAKLIEDLEYQYSRLENAIAKAFGSDYVTNYNQQLQNLAAQQEAYLKQAEAERSKGKKADEEKIKDYENSARDAADKILDMQSQLSEFFSGTDITSAAKDFADSWLEAYKEFGSTTIAMREKFQEMVEEMVQKSLAAKVMQELLTPIFNEIDRLAQEGGELSVSDIAAIAQMADQQIPAINDAMLTLMNTLTQAGYNLRSQPGQFTGIARNIANASEESITGLAAGINTQNFYLSYMPTISANVAAILMHLTGGTADTTGATPITPTNNERVMEYMSALPNIDANVASILNIMAKFEKTICEKNSSTNVNVIAVRA